MKLWNKICNALEEGLKASVRIFVKVTKKTLKITKSVAPIVVSAMHLLDGGTFTGAVCRFVGMFVYGELVYQYVCFFELELIKKDRAAAAV